MGNDLQYRTKTFALAIIALVKKLDGSVGDREIGKQLIRSAMLVGSNTRATFRARSSKEYIAKAKIVIEEADESAYWLELLEASSDSDKIMHNELNLLQKEAEEITAIFISLVRKEKERT